MKSDLNIHRTTTSSTCPTVTVIIKHAILMMPTIDDSLHFLYSLLSSLATTSSVREKRNKMLRFSVVILVVGT
jgi:hypothetical protein